MKNAIAAAALLLVGCATTNARDTITPSPVQMIGDFEADEAARFAHLADTDRDGTAEADVRVCVAADGQVSSAEVVKSSGSDEFDGAVVRDVSKASYRPLAGPGTVRVCNEMRVVINEG